MAQLAAHKTAKNNSDTTWIAAYFLGVETSSGSYLVVNQDGIFTIANIRRDPNESAFDKNIIDDVKLSHADYVSNGSSTVFINCSTMIASWLHKATGAGLA